MIGVPTGGGRGVEVGSRVAVAVGEGVAEGWRVGVADGEGRGVAERLAVVVGEEMAVTPRVGVVDDAPSDGVAVVASGGVVVAISPVGVSVTTELAVTSWSARAPGRNAARRPRPHTARAVMTKMTMVAR